MKFKRTLKPNLSLKKLREITGLTQRDFAVMVGVSLPLIKMVECGLKPLTKGLAEKIAIATGAQLLWWDFRKIRNGKASKVPVQNGKVYWVAHEDMVEELMKKSTKRLSHTEYSREHFNYHRKFFKTDPATAERVLKEALPALRALFKTAATTHGQGEYLMALPALRSSLWEWMRAANEKFKLGIRPPED